jgi:hypothetical protein
MSLTSKVPLWLECAEVQAQISALQSASKLPQMVRIAMRLGFMLACWLLETDLSERAHRPQAWPACKTCSKRLHSKGWQRRHMQTLVGTIG